MDLFSRTTNSKKMRNDLNSNRSLWGHQSSPDAIRLSQVHGLLEAIEKRDYTEILKLYYRSQHQHTLNPKKKPLDIHVYIHRNQLDIKWIPHVEYAIKAIDGVTPGVNLFETIERDKSMIRIGVDDLKEQTMACTIHGSVLDLIKDPSRAKPFIHLGGKWREDQMKGTSIHELMHALSFHHEMQRFDTDLYLDVDENLDHNFCKKTDYALTRFDPFSVMMYPESIHLKRKEDGDRIWEMKETRERCQELSELNKVALNLIYKPCVNKFKNYSPKLSIQTQMLYCGRKVMITHNQVGESTTDGNCGPNNWANCPACRVITRIKDDENKSTEIPKLTKCLERESGKV